MLRLKWWLDTRFWFFLGLMALSAQVLALYMSYPMDPATSYPNGALGVTAAEMTRLRTGDFRGYIWVRWFSTTMLLIWPVFALRLAGTGFEDVGWPRLPVVAARHAPADRDLTPDRQRGTNGGARGGPVVARLRDGTASGTALSGRRRAGPFGDPDRRQPRALRPDDVSPRDDQGCRRVCGGGWPDLPGRRCSRFSRKDSRRTASSG